MVLSPIFAWDNCKICICAADNGVVEPGMDGIGVSGGGACVSGVGGCEFAGVPVGISYGPKAFVSCAKIFNVEKATNVAAANVMPVLWKPCLFIKSHFLCNPTPQPRAGCAACQGALNQAIASIKSSKGILPFRNRQSATIRRTPAAAPPAVPRASNTP